MSDNIIEFHNVKKSYGDHVIIPNLNVNIERGDFLTIIGSSGCGKTTMLKMINRLINPDEGEILIDGKDVSELDVIKLRRSIGYSIQGTMLFPHLTVRENISYVPDLIAEDDKKAFKYESTQDNKLKKIKKDKELKAKEKSRDATKEQEIKKIHEKTNITIIFITHDIGEALYLGKHVIVMDEGEINQYGEPAEILNNPATPFVEKLCERTKDIIEGKNNSY